MPRTAHGVVSGRASPVLLRGRRKRLRVEMLASGPGRNKGPEGGGSVLAI